MTNKIPVPAVNALKSIRSINCAQANILYRIGTNGERGLHPQLKKTRTTLKLAIAKFNSDFPEYTIILSNNEYFIKKV